MRSSLRPWSHLVSVFLRPPVLSSRQWSVFGLLLFASFFDMYDYHLYTLNLVLIQRDLNIPESRIGTISAIITAGSVFAFLLTYLSDWIGRRRVLLFTIIGFTVATGMTAFSSNIIYFVTTQFLARVFITAELLLAVIVIAEEFPAAARGWGICSLCAFSTLGQGMALLLFNFVNEIPYGWRAFYVIAFIPLCLLAVFRRNLPESEVFEKYKSNFQLGKLSRLKPLKGVVMMYPERVLKIVSIWFLIKFSLFPVLLFSIKYLLDLHHWSRPKISILALIAGGLGLFLLGPVGKYSDRQGRRGITVFALFTIPVAAVAFYNSTGMILGLAFCVLSLSSFVGLSLMTTYNSEVFPTSHRGTANGIRVAISTLGGMLGLYCESLLFQYYGNHWESMVFICIPAFLASFLAFYVLPETHGMPLSQTAPEIG